MTTPQKPAVVDGSTMRLYRLITLAQYIRDHGPVSESRLQAWGTIEFGLKSRTTSAMIKDLHNARIIKANSNIFSITPDGQKWLNEKAKENTL